MRLPTRVANQPRSERFSAQFAPHVVSEHQALIQSLLRKYRDSTVRNQAEKGYITLSTERLQQELANVQLQALRSMVRNRTTKAWLTKCEALFPGIEGTIAIEEPMAIAMATMTESERRHSLQPKLTRQHSPSRRTASGQ